MGIRRRAKRGFHWLKSLPDRLAAHAVGIASLLSNRPSDAIKWEPTEVMRLYRDIRQRKPQSVMEFGVGCSTLVIAHALHRNGGGHHICIDAAPKWIEVCRAGMPKHLVPYVTFHYSTLRMIDFQGTPAHVYENVPENELDYLLVDGPAREDIPGWRGKVMAADPIMMQQRFRPGFRMVVEGRVKNVGFLRQHLTGFAISEDKPANWTNVRFAAQRHQESEHLKARPTFKKVSVWQACPRSSFRHVPRLTPTISAASR